MSVLNSRIPKEKKNLIIDLYYSGSSTRNIAKKTGIPKSTIFDFISSNKFKSIIEERNMHPNLLYLDVEVSASVVLAFPRWNVNVHKDGVISEPYMLTYAAAWGDGDIFTNKLTDYDTFDFNNSNDLCLIGSLRALLDRADVVVAHNAKFDVGWFNQRCAYWDLAPPSPYKVVCTLKEVKKNFSLPANSLDAAAKYFGLTHKLSHSGLSLWKDAMMGKKEAFDELEEYNKGDIVTLRELYLKVRPFIKSHPNMALFKASEARSCYKCGSDNLMETDKHTITSLGKFKLFYCYDCNSFNSDKTSVLDKDKRDSLNRGTI